MSFRLCGYEFEGPYSSTGSLRNSAGVYLILKDNRNITKVDVVDVGESADVRERIETHDRKGCWERHAAIVYYAVHYTPNASESRRQEIEREVRACANPPCGER